MDTPVCLSKYFVNKQNFRSYSNIMKSKYFKEENSFFSKHLFRDDLLRESDISTDLMGVLLLLKDNIQSKSKNDFKTYFSSIENGIFQSLSKDDIFRCCWEGLCVIIPKNFFGNGKNTRLLQQLVKKIIFSMKYQHFQMNYFIDKWDFTVYPWTTLNGSKTKQIQFNILLWIFKYVLSPMISLNFYVTTCKLDSNENELHFFWKNQWQSFYDKKISDMMTLNVIKKVQLYSLGKKLKKTRNQSENIKLKNINKNIPKLHLVLKPNNAFRPLVRYKSEQKTAQEKYRIKDRLNLLKKLTGKPSDKIETGFIKLHQQWLRLNKPKLYFVKADLSNAFGSIDREKLIKIMRERHLNFQRTERNASLKKQIARQYKEMVAELQKPLLVRSGSTVFEWRKGLVQGYKYSPALSELYYKYMDEIYFAEHLKIGDDLKFFIRVVDDYLYITASLDDAELFLEALSKYGNVNYKKTIVNFEYPGITYSINLTFLGYTYNTENLEVSRTSNVYLGQMCYKITFTSAIINLYKFIENRIGQSGIQVNGHLFNFYYNSEELVWKHIFTTFCLSANKFCTILAIVCEEKEMLNYILLYKSRVTVKLTNSFIETLSKNKPKDFIFRYCINHFRYLSWMAFSLCAKNTPKCLHLVTFIKDELAKTNCIFGKWREHASRISVNGECTQEAVKAICRRPDLRIIIKKLHTLPDGFEFYNHKYK